MVQKGKDVVCRGDCVIPAGLRQHEPESGWLMSGPLRKGMGQGWCIEVAQHGQKIPKAGAGFLSRGEARTAVELAAR